MKKNLYSGLLFLIVSFFLCLIWYYRGLLMGGGESGLPFYSLDHYLQITRFAWNNIGLGGVTGLSIASAPTYYALGILQRGFVSSYLLEASVFFILFFLSSVFIFLWTREFFTSINRRYLLLSAFFYWFNPLSLVDVWNRFLYNYMFFFALFPVGAFFYLKGLKDKKYVFALVIGLTMGIFSYALTAIPFNILLWLVFGYTTVFFLIFDKEKKDKLFDILFFFLTLGCFSIVNLWWISQLLSFVNSSSFTASVSDFFTSTGNLAGLSTLSQELGLFINTFRLMHVTFFDQGPSWAYIYNFPLLVILEFMVSGVIFWTIFHFRRMKEVLFLATLFLITLFLMKGNGFPFGEPFQYAFLKSSTIQVFRNPFEKFGFLLPLAAAPLFAFGVGKISESINSRKKRNLFLTGVFVFLIGVWGFPFWTGLVFTSDNVYGKLTSYEVKVPDYYQQANNWLNSQGDNFRFVSLPLGGEGMSYTWDKSYSGVELSSTLFNTPNISFDTTIPFYHDIASELEKVIFSSSNFSSFLSDLDVKYLVVRSDIDWRARGVKNPEEALSFLHNSSQVHQVASFGKLNIFELNSSSNGMIYPSVNFINSYTKQDLSDLLTVNASSSAVLYSGDYPQLNQNTSTILLKPINEGSVVVSKTYTPEQALNQLLYVNHLPNDKFYQFILLKEALDRSSFNDSDGLLTYDLNILGKRAAEIYKLVQSRLFNNIPAADGRYEKDFEGLVPQMKFLISTKPQAYMGLLSDTFAKHEALLQAAEKDSSGGSKNNLDNLNKKINQELINIGLSSTFPLVEELPDLSNENRWIYRFSVPYPGQYNIVLSKNNWENFYETVPSSLTMQIDNNLVRRSVLDDEDNFNLGLINLSSGIHEVSFNIPESKNLIQSKDDFIINSFAGNKLSFPVLPFSPYYSYQVSFDYFIQKGNKFEMDFAENNDPVINGQAKDYFSQTLTADTYDHGFRSASYTITPSSGASGGLVVFDVKDANFCPKSKIEFLSPCNNKDTKKLYSKETVVEIKNLKVQKVYDNNLFLTLNKPVVGSKVPKVTYDQINPTRYNIHVSGASGPFILTLSQLYNSGWEAKFSNNAVVKDHLLVNAYANGWYIDRPGDYDMVIDYVPQKLLNLTEQISLSAFILISAAVGGYFLWRKRA